MVMVAGILFGPFAKLPTRPEPVPLSFEELVLRENIRARRPSPFGREQEVLQIQ
jgi:hypothetical protein